MNVGQLPNKVRVNPSSMFGCWDCLFADATTDEGSEGKGGAQNAKSGAQQNKALEERKKILKNRKEPEKARPAQQEETPCPHCRECHSEVYYFLERKRQELLREELTREKLDKKWKRYIQNFMQKQDMG